MLLHLYHHMTPHLGLVLCHLTSEWCWSVAELCKVTDAVEWVSTLKRCNVEGVTGWQIHSISVYRFEDLQLGTGSWSALFPMKHTNMGWLLCKISSGQLWVLRVKDNVKKLQETHISVSFSDTVETNFFAGFCSCLEYNLCVYIYSPSAAFSPLTRNKKKIRKMFTCLKSH